MARLPFAVEPRLKPIIERIGNEEIGIFEIERRGYLTAAEKSFVQQFLQGDDSTVSLIALSRKIARKYGMPLADAYEELNNFLSGASSTNNPNIDLEGDFGAEVREVVSAMSTGQVKVEIMQAACMVMRRIDDSCTLDDVLELHPDLIVELSNFYREEEQKSIERLVKNSAEEATDLKDKVKNEVEELEKKRARSSKDG